MHELIQACTARYIHRRIDGQIIETCNHAQSKVGGRGGKLGTERERGSERERGRETMREREAMREREREREREKQ